MRLVCAVVLLLLPAAGALEDDAEPYAMAGEPNAMHSEPDSMPAEAQDGRAPAVDVACRCLTYDMHLRWDAPETVQPQGSAKGEVWLTWAQDATQNPDGDDPLAEWDVTLGTPDRTAREFDVTFEPASYRVTAADRLQAVPYGDGLAIVLPFEVSWQAVAPSEQLYVKVDAQTDSEYVLAKHLFDLVNATVAEPAPALTADAPAPVWVPIAALGAILWRRRV